jgi:hypothetical protein
MLLLDKLRLKLPAQPAPKITTDFPTTARLDNIRGDRPGCRALAKMLAEASCSPAIALPSHFFCRSVASQQATTCSRPSTPAWWGDEPCWGTASAPGSKHSGTEASGSVLTHRSRPEEIACEAPTTEALARNMHIWIRRDSMSGQADLLVGKCHANPRQERCDLVNLEQPTRPLVCYHLSRKGVIRVGFLQAAKPMPR